MKGIYDHLNSWLRRKEAEKFTTDGDGNTAVRIDGEISLEIEVSTGLTQNISAAVAGTEYTFTIPVGTKRFEWSSRKNSTVKWTFQSGQSGIIFSTLEPGNIKQENNLKLTTPIVIYFQCSKSGDTIELSSWS